MEDFEDHEDYISAHVKKPNEDDDAVIFVSYTIKNKGDETYTFKDDRFYPNNDVLPNLIHPENYILDVDIAYPEDGPADDMEDVTDLTLDPGESMEITGSVLPIQETKTKVRLYGTMMQISHKFFLQDHNRNVGIKSV